MAKVDPIPAEYPRVSPYLSVDDAAAAIRFYCDILGATERGRMTGPDGKVGHAELEIGGSVVMLSDPFPGMSAPTPTALGGSAVTLMVYVTDVAGAGPVLRRPFGPVRGPLRPSLEHRLPRRGRLVGGDGEAGRRDDGRLARPATNDRDDAGASPGPQVRRQVPRPERRRGERGDEGLQRPARSRERIPAVIDLDDTRGRQGLQPLGQRCRGDAGQAPADLVEPAAPHEQLTHDQQRPALADDLERPGHCRTGRRSPSPSDGTTRRSAGALQRLKLLNVARTPQHRCSCPRCNRYPRPGPFPRAGRTASRAERWDALVGSMHLAPAPV
jgi:catechol 2,3-dioxygenase-like lactoylglutathione lyase family enzyme